MSKAIGIDLGTTNSVASVYNGESSRILLNPHNEELTPSVVCCEKFEEDEEGEILVGRSAANQARLFPRDTIYSVKRLMGRPFKNENVQRLKKAANYQIAEAKEPAGQAAVMMGGKEYLPEDISAMILSEIRRYSETSLGEKVTHSVITVPAYFGEPEKGATREAGRRAGLVVKTLLPEPTAAALAYGVQAQSEAGSFVLVFDLGGGTFDISVISIVGQNYNVMEVYGDQFLGGDDFDEKIVQMILSHVQEKYGVDLSQDQRFRIIAKSEAEKTKKALSGSSSSTILVPEAAEVGNKSINLKLKVSRQDFEKSIGDEVKRCMKLVDEALKHQSLTRDDITDVLLVGGSTAVPMVHQAVEAVFGKEKVRRDVNPMHCVAIGAGILAQRMKGIECPQCKTLCDESLEACPNCEATLAVARSVYEGMEVTEITSNFFGVQAVSGSDPYAFEILVEKGTEIPMHQGKRKTLYTTDEDQQLIRVPVYEGLGASVLQNSRIGVIEYELPTGLPRNHPIHVTLLLDRHSLVTVTIEVEEFGLRHEQSLKRELVDEEEVADEPLIDDEEEDELDEQEKALAILETFLGRAQMFLSEYDSILTPAQKTRLSRAIEEAQQAVDNDEGAKAKALTVDLDRLMVRCGTASLIDQAHLAGLSTDEETANELREKADQLRDFAERGDHARVQQMSTPLASLIRQVHRKSRQVQKIKAEEQFGGLLRREG